MIQAIDLKKEYSRRKSLVKGLRKSFDMALTRNHGPIDVLRVAIWYCEIEERLGCGSTYAVERRLEPDAFSTTPNGHIAFHRNKWQRYRVGRNEPNSKLVQHVDSQLPGTAVLLNHFLWDCLKNLITLERQRTEGVRSLSPGILMVLFGKGTEIDPSSIRIDARKLKMLERRPGLDALACLTFVLRNCLIRNDVKAAYSTGFYLRRVLVMTCKINIGLRVYTSVLGSLYEQDIFAKFDCLKPLMGFNYVKALKELDFGVPWLEDERIIGFSHKDGIQAMVDLFNGKYFRNGLPLEEQEFLFQLST